MHRSHHGTTRRLASLTGVGTTLALVTAATAAGRPLMPDGEPIPGTAGPASGATSPTDLDPATFAQGTADGTDWIAFASLGATVVALAIVIALIVTRRPATAH